MVGVVVLNYKNPGMTIKCLNSLLMLEVHEWEAVVVDNASGDGSIEQIRTAHPWVTVIESPVNLGFAGGCRLGYEYFTKKKIHYLWLLNNDAEADSACLGYMLQAVTADPRIGAVGSQVQDAQRNGKVLTYGGGGVSLWLGRAWHQTSQAQLSDLDYLTGASLLVSMQAITEVGFIDDGYFLYYEDVDFSLELRKHGYKLVVAVDAIVYHNESSTIGRNSSQQCYYLSRAFVRFCFRQARYPLISLVLGASTRVLKRLFLGRWREMFVIIGGIRDGWMLRYEKMGERKM